ncbi:hypothetical protein [Rhizobium sp. SL42]|uniref:hypothetical protein n=1 Tax=Rhizobium sp. SL42 TaxID=2806346 RepID=UPI001F2ED691|nr:hypothetical protein [Rhizobium sp. SL42]UJW75525.1 hypothetical protein IM739_03190 [Rhizobium sp. SL42]
MFQGNFRPPIEKIAGAADIRLPPPWIIDRQAKIDHILAGRDFALNHYGQLVDSEFVRIAQVIGHAGLSSRSIIATSPRPVRAWTTRLDDAAFVGLHVRTTGIEQPGDARVYAAEAKEIETRP